MLETEDLRDNSEETLDAELLKERRCEDSVVRNERIGE